MKLNLNIKKTLSIIKVHTTGLDTDNDRIVGITISQYKPDGTHKSGTRVINPECHIPKEAIDIHGITNDMAEKEKTFDEIGENLYNFIGDSDIAGFNVKFDIEMLANEFSRLKLPFKVYTRSVFDLYDMYVNQNPRNFLYAINQYVDSEFKLGGPIGTEEYTELCSKLMDKMVGPIASDTDEDIKSAYSKLGVNTQMLDVKGWFIMNANKKPIFAFGKHKGELVADVVANDSGYYEWMKNKAGLAQDTLEVAEMILKQARAKAEA